MMFCGRAKNVIFPSRVLDNKILRIQVFQLYGTNLIYILWNFV